MIGLDPTQGMGLGCWETDFRVSGNWNRRTDGGVISLVVRHEADNNIAIIWDSCEGETTYRRWLTLKIFPYLFFLPIVLL